MSNPKIGICLGSKSDLPQLEKAQALLTELGVPYEVRIMSAHRTPATAAEYARTARDRGIKVLIGMAGVAAHLAGALAAHSDLPVLGIPAAGGPLQGFDALLSTVQMPPGVPVATFAVGKMGATNAALFACQIIAQTEPDVQKAIVDYRAAMRKKVEAADRELNG